MPGGPARAASRDERRALAEREADKRNQLHAQSASPDPEVRADAATRIEPDPEGIDTLADLRANDPESQVRIAAAATLGDSRTPAALRQLIGALDAIEWTDDPAAIPYVAGCSITRIPR